MIAPFEIGTVFSLRDRQPEGYPYNDVEVAGFQQVSESEVEAVLAPLDAFAPVLVLPGAKLYAAGFDLNSELQEKVKARRAAAAQAVEDEQAAAAIRQPWEFEVKA